MKFLMIFSILFFPACLLSQTSDSLEGNVKYFDRVYVNDIIIAGNDVTDDDVILREMNTKKHGIFNIETVQNDAQRVSNLGLFNKVEIIPVIVAQDSVNLYVTVEEVFYIIPIPQGGIKEGDFKKAWAGLNVKWRNFRGRNETLGLSFGIGYDPFVSASYYNPWIGKKAHLFTSANVKYSKTINKTVDAASEEITVINRDSIPGFAVYNFETGLTLGKFVTQNLSFSGTYNYNYIRLSQYQPGRTLSPEGKDIFSTVSAEMNYDTRNSNTYSTFGSYYDLKYSKHGIFNQYIDFNKIKFDLRRFIPIKLSDTYAITFAVRSTGAVSFGGNVPVYLLESFGYERTLRGWDENIITGENLLGQFFELRVPVIKPYYISGSSIPIVKSISFLKKFSYKFGLYTTAFFDVGGVWNRKDNFFNTSFRNGYGVGLNLILPFDFIGRVDMSFSKETGKLKPHFILALSPSF